MSTTAPAPIPYPSAWTRTSLAGGEEAFVRALTPAQIGVLEAFAAEAADRPLEALTADGLADESLRRLVAECRREILDGTGAVIIRGLAHLAPAAFERAYLGLGMLMGTPAVQSRRGDMLGYVQKEENNVNARGYRSQSELTFHCDSYEIVGLACVRQAESGGLTRLVSGPAIYNEVVRTRPDLLPALYAGFHYAIPEARGTAAHVTPHRLPVFCTDGARISCMYVRDFMQDAAAALQVPLPPGLAEAMDHFDSIMLRPDMHLEFPIRPGDMLIWHNFTHLHARTAFENSASRQRLLLRLWLTVPDGRRVDPALYERGKAYDRVYREARGLA